MPTPHPPPTPRLPFREAGYNLAIVRELFFFLFWEESCKSLRAAPGLRVTISCLEERIISPLEHEAPPPPAWLWGSGAPATPALLSSPQETGTFSTFCARKGHSFSPGPRRAAEVRSPCEPAGSELSQSRGTVLTAFPSCPRAGSRMTPTLWPGFSPSRLQPANFLASKAIWYPAARQRCGPAREAGAGPGALGNRKDILCPSSLTAFHSHLEQPPRPLQKTCRAGEGPTAGLLDKTWEPASFPGEPGRLENRTGPQRIRNLHAQPYRPPARRCFPTSASDRTSML